MSTQQSNMPDTQERHGKKRHKIAKPYQVWYKAKRESLCFREWSLFGRYKDEKTAQEVIRQKSSDPVFEYRIFHDE